MTGAKTEEKKKQLQFCSWDQLSLSLEQLGEQSQELEGEGESESNNSPNHHPRDFVMHIIDTITSFTVIYSQSVSHLESPLAKVYGGHTNVINE